MFDSHFRVQEIHLRKECDFLEEYIASVRKQADEILNCMRTILTAEKKKRGYVNRDYAIISNMSEDAIKLMLSDKSKNPSYVAVVSLATSLGLDLNELAGYTPPSKTDTTAVISVQEPIDEIVSTFAEACDKRVDDVKAMLDMLLSIYDKRLADRDAMWEARLADNNAMWELRYNDLKDMNESLLRK